MKNLISVLFVVVLVILFSVTIAQDSTSTTVPLPTLSRNAPYWDAFPGNLYCYDIGRPSPGPTWDEIIIGLSSAEALLAYVEPISKMPIAAKMAACADTK
jgi:hypothetical protein